MNLQEFYYNNLLPFEKREEIRQSQVFKNFIWQWNHGIYNRASDVGSFMAAAKECFDFYDRQGISPTLELWTEWYFTKVKSIEEIIPHIKRIKEETGLPDAVKAITYFHIHIIDGAFWGMLGELKAKKAVEDWIRDNKKEAVVRFATDDEDRKGGVDLIVEDHTGKVLCGIQVKRTPYFKSTRATVVKAREQINPQKYRQFKEEFNADVWYLDVQKLEEGFPLGPGVWWKALK